MNLKQVAAVAGVSVSTVSRVLNGKSYVNEETRKIVTEAIRKTNYQPNALAQSLKMGRSNTICLMIPSIENLMFPKLTRGVEDEARKNGMTVFLCNTDEDAAIEKSYLETMKQRWIDGFIVCSLSSDAPHIRSLRDEGYPLVLVNRFEESDIGKVDTVIINAGECEPYITADDRLCREHPAELMKGLKIIMKIFGLAEGHIAIEDNKPDCIEKLTELVKDEPRIEVCPLQTKYPQGAERQLIYAVTKRAINSSMLPADAGCIVDNVETLIGIHMAVAEGKPLTERVVTVSGDAINSPGNFKVLLGTNHMELIEAAGGFSQQPEKLISGGPMMGFAMVSAEAPVTKTSSSILAFKEDIVSKSVETACINCARCVDVCPSRIIPSRLADLAQRHDEKAFVAMNGLECVECGSCSYVCPAKRPLKQAIGSMRKIALANKRKK